MLHDGDDDLASAVAVAGDVAGKRVDVGHDMGALLRRGGAAHASAEGDGLAGDFAHERAEDEGLLLRAVCCCRFIQDVEAGPVDAAVGGREGVVQMPEEGGGVGEVAYPVPLVMEQCRRL